MGPRCGAYSEAGNHLKILPSAFVSSRQTTYTRFLKRGGKGTRCDAYGEAGDVLNTRMGPGERVIGTHVTSRDAARGGSTKYHFSSSWLRPFESDRERRDLVTCGCAAGVAAAFRAPVGGVLFALEEVTSWWRSQLMWRVFFTSAIVAVVVRTAMAWCKSGKCGHFGSGGFIIWDISGGQEDYSFKELLPMAIIGIIGGLFGALFNQLTLYITSWRRNYLHKKGNRVKIIEVLLISLMTSVISFGLPLLRKCSPCPNSEANPDIDCPQPPGTDGNFVNFFCSTDKEYNDLATIFFNTQDDAIRNLFSAKTFHEYSAQSLLTFLVVDFLSLIYLLLTFWQS
ncbi:hypothetical protein IEQ34_020063 [Dendrobium chrysotoxum]|uniref:Chloride channel protein CLC-d n=1 Tax=Dendrobium chrysotoxum TaxID=161865 RepID=A0AAV7FZ57_DENCH|nr:hypothetical protein IEQ34_020063 [Dendrobium chrysotoxum]